ncbi:MAG: Crp/Fnr family transcriptional regulator [Janthinobacterium lividum]
MAHPLTNRLLESLSPSIKADLMKFLEPVALPLKTVMFEAGQTPRYAYFLTSGLASVVTVMAGGEAVEVGLTGREGFPQGLHLLGPERGDTRAFMQAAGTGLRMEFKRFEQEFKQVPEITTAVLRFVQSESLVMGQLAACNRLHEIEERLARWLLMVADRTGELQMELTQEFLGEMLGTRRSSVTIAASSLQRSGLINYRRGHIEILDRPRLEDAACECYPITRRLFDNLYR